MSATTLTHEPVALGRTADASVTFPRVVRAEWGKLMSLRSTWWTIGVVLLLQVGMAALLALLARSDLAAAGGDPTTGMTLDATQLATAGLQFTQLAVVVLGVLTITAEYSSGQIRATLAAVPTRWPVLGAKAAALGGLTVALAAVAGAAGLGTGLLVAGDRVAFDLPTEQTLRILAGGPLYLLGIALLALGVGALLRSTAGAIALLMAFLLVIEAAFAVVPLRVLQEISPFLPGTAGAQLLYSEETLAAMRQVNPVGAVLDPWVGYGILVAWVAVVMVAALALLRRRDA